MTTLVFNGWAAGAEIWAQTTFKRDRIFDYLEQIAGLPEKRMEALDSALLVGFSMGSMTALRLLCRYPRKVRGLVLISATPRMMEEKAERDGEVVKIWNGFSPRRLAAFRMGTEFTFRGNPSPLYAPENLHKGLAFLENTDLRGELERTVSAHADLIGSMPVAVFHSERDGIVRPENVEYFKKVFPQATVAWVPGNEHALPVKVPDLISAVVGKMQNAKETR